MSFPLNCSPVMAAAFLLLGAALSRPAVADSVSEEALIAIVQLGSQGDGNEGAIQAANQLRTLPADRVTVVLNAMTDASPVGQNWLRGIATDIVRSSNSVPVELLTAYVRETSNSPTGRATAITILESTHPELALQLTRDGLNDASLLIRERAVADAMDQAKKLDKPASIAKYQKTLTSARHPKQVSGILSALRDLGEPISTADAFEMIRNWEAVAPFDNVDGVGYGRIYPPEADFTDDGQLDRMQSYEGKKGEVAWKKLDADQNSGKLDLAAAFNKEKGAVAYVYTEFTVKEAQTVQFRLGCINANKVWLNGEEIMANEVYHSGSMIDQYVAEAGLSAGTNRILLKVCQNEQTQPWAQDWELQFRVTDLTGKGIPSAE